MTDNKEHMLDLCFEIEGLLALMLKRENEVPEKVEILLKQKIAQLSELGGACLATHDLTGDTIAQSAEFEEKEDSEGIAIEPEKMEDSPAAIEANESTATIEANATEDTEEGEDIEPSEEEISESVGTPQPISLTLNDKFRFRRELFGNNAAELSDALDVANAVSSQAELDDYFYNDLCWDPENPDVKDFMALASARFKK